MLREEGFRDGDIHPDVEHNGADEHQADKPGMVEHPLQRFAIAFLHRHQETAKAFATRLGVRLAALEHPPAHHRRERQRNQQRDADGDRKRDGKLPQQPTRQAAHQQQRQEHRHQGQAHGEHRKAHLARPLQCGLKRLHARFQMAGNVLQHHDSVIHHKTRRNGQGHQRQVIEAKPAQVHGGKGANKRHRHGHRRDQRRPTGAQEQEYHQDHQCDGDHQRLLHLLKRGANGRGTILGNLQIDRGRDSLLQLREAGANAVHRLNNVRFRQLTNHQQDSRFGVGHPGVAYVLHGVRHAGDIA